MAQLKLTNTVASKNTRVCFEAKKKLKWLRSLSVLTAKVQVEKGRPPLPHLCETLFLSQI